MSDVKTGAKMYVLRLGSITCDTNALVAFDTRATALDPEPKCKFEPFPIWGLYIEHPDGKIIFDTGFREDCLTGGEGPTVPINVPITLPVLWELWPDLFIHGVSGYSRYARNTAGILTRSH